MWECIVARIRENESPRLLATYIVDLLTSINVDLWAIATRVLPYESADLARGAVCLGVPPLSGLVWVVVGCVRVVDALSLFFLWVSFCVVALWSLGDGECGGDCD